MESGLKELKAKDGKRVVYNDTKLESGLKELKVP